jgi:hypothetical protein
MNQDKKDRLTRDTEPLCKELMRRYNALGTIVLLFLDEGPSGPDTRKVGMASMIGVPAGKMHEMPAALRELADNIERDHPGGVCHHRPKDAARDLLDSMQGKVEEMEPGKN